MLTGDGQETYRPRHLDGQEASADFRHRRASSAAFGSRLSLARFRASAPTAASMPATLLRRALEDRSPTQDAGERIKDWIARYVRFRRARLLPLKVLLTPKVLQPLARHHLRHHRHLVLRRLSRPRLGRVVDRPALPVLAHATRPLAPPPRRLDVPRAGRRLQRACRNPHPGGLRGRRRPRAGVRAGEDGSGAGRHAPGRARHERPLRRLRPADGEPHGLPRPARPGRDVPAGACDRAAAERRDGREQVERLDQGQWRAAQARRQAGASLSSLLESGRARSDAPSLLTCSRRCSSRTIRLLLRPSRLSRQQPRYQSRSPPRRARPSSTSRRRRSATRSRPPSTSPSPARRARAPPRR